jgi:lipopolysaccharide/colanic/teichoic acid biosynthesis glycosyltransferase
MTKRLLDVLFALAAIILTLPIVGLACLLIWAGDGNWPLYRGVRVGRGNRDFKMIKMRTMVPDAEWLGGSSTAASDPRLTRLGAVLRRFKIDELPQFWNVLIGNMSVVGPRPNVRRGGVDRYTGEELKLLLVKPGITDLASIVFSDEAQILEGAGDPDARYDALIRPWKNRLGLLYVERRSIAADLNLILLTMVSLVSRRAALFGIHAMLERWDASPELRAICARSDPLPAGEPPGEPA